MGLVVKVSWVPDSWFRASGVGFKIQDLEFGLCG